MAITDETLMAYADGELESAERAEVEAAIAGDPALAETVERHRRLRARVGGFYAPILDEPVPARLREVLAHHEAASGSVADIAAYRARRRQRLSLPWWQGVTALAASLVIGLLLGRGMAPDTPTVAPTMAPIVAGGPILAALDRQLASEQAPDAPVVVGLSFESRDGRFCRTFETRETVGLASRDRDAWAIIALEPQSAPPEPSIGLLPRPQSLPPRSG